MWISHGINWFSRTGNRKATQVGIQTTRARKYVQQQQDRSASAAVYRRLDRYMYNLTLVCDTTRPSGQTTTFLVSSSSCSLGRPRTHHTNESRRRATSPRNYGSNREKRQKRNRHYSRHLLSRPDRDKGAQQWSTSRSRSSSGILSKTNTRPLESSSQDQYGTESFEKLPPPASTEYNAQNA